NPPPQVQSPYPKPQSAYQQQTSVPPPSSIVTSAPITSTTTPGIPASTSAPNPPGAQTISSGTVVHPLSYPSYPGFTPPPDDIPPPTSSASNTSATPYS